MEDLTRWCFAWPEPNPRVIVGQERATLLLRAKWGRGESIRIAFLDGDRIYREKVKTFALIWTGLFLANLRFVFIEDPRKADIRISFKYPGSWSMIGCTCRNQKDPSKPTMNLSWPEDEEIDEDRIRREVLHEFGHAIGLVHEHQSPKAGIQWNRENVLKDLSPHWSEERIEKNVFTPFEVKETNFTYFDPKSIMVYPIPPHWTKDGYSVSGNNDLSILDQQLIRSIYPY